MNAQSIQLSGLGTESLAETLRLQLVPMRPKALGIASAFVSVRGVREVLSITRRAGTPDCRLLAGISHAVTHPEALNEALDAGWDIRLGANPTAQGIFHPKLIVAGGGFDKKGNVESPSFAYVGSSNLTYGGLRINVECGLLAIGAACPSGVSASFAELWRLATPATETLLRRYAEEFAARNRRRAVEDIEALGIADSVETDVRSYAALLRARGGKLACRHPHDCRASCVGRVGVFHRRISFPSGVSASRG